MVNLSRQLGCVLNRLSGCKKMLLLCFISVAVFMIVILSKKSESSRRLRTEKVNVVTKNNIKEKLINEAALKLLTQQTIKNDSVEVEPCQNVHAFYYPWYGNPQFNGEYIHWNHKYLPHWNPNIAPRYPSGYHSPPGDIGSNFYPDLGPYSSEDSKVIENHMQQLQSARIGVVVVSYYPPGGGDDNGKDWQHIFPLLFQYAEKYDIKIAFHIEPYKSRTETTVKEDISYIIKSYQTYPAFYKYSHKGKKLPLIYVYDSYHVPARSWAQIFGEGVDSIRGTDHDAFVIGLVVERKDLYEMLDAGFDGFYTYFASDGFTYGSTRSNWAHLSQFAQSNNLIYIPSVGPGYIDTRVRPWNAHNTRQRLKGKYYSESWETALSLSPDIVSITSFNEWHEGTQIEKAIPKQIKDFQYIDYSPYSSNYYLELTKMFLNKFKKCIKNGG